MTRFCRIAENRQGSLGGSLIPSDLADPLDRLFDILVVGKESGRNSNGSVAFQCALVLVDHGCTVKSCPHTQLVICIQHCTDLFSWQVANVYGECGNSGLVASRSVDLYTGYVLKSTQQTHGRAVFQLVDMPECLLAGSGMGGELRAVAGTFPAQFGKPFLGGVEPCDSGYGRCSDFNY